MHTGLGLQFANLDNKVTDAEVYCRELALGGRAEEAGFDSVFVSEHHFSDYQLTSDQMMVLSWIAAQTTRVKLGTFVTVLPWHDPVRVTESFSVLDHLSDGRAILGLGRGLGRVEFEGFRLEMGESRRRFAEYSEAILDALETGYIEYDGELYQQPRVPIRPRPTLDLQGPDVRVRGLAAVDRADGANGRRDHGDRAEAVGDRGGGAAGVPPALPRAQRDRGAEAVARRRRRREQGPRGGRAAARRSTSSAGRARPSSTTSSTTRGSPRSRATSTTAPSRTTSRSTGSTSSTVSSPICRCGARRNR